MDINLPITKIKGIGEKRAKIFAKLNIYTIKDLIHYYPRDYESKKEICNIANIELNNVNIIKAKVKEEPTNLYKKKFVITKMRVRDKTGELFVFWYNQPYLKNKFKLNDDIILKGKVTYNYGKIKMEAPQIINEDQLLMSTSQEFLPIYPITKGLSLKQLTNIINEGLKYTNGQLKDSLSKEIKDRYNLCEYNYALQQIHNPKDSLSLELAKKRLIFDEFLLFQLNLLSLKKECYSIKNKYNFTKNKLEDNLLLNLPFQLTNAQKKAWLEIKDDMMGKKTMNRLVQGDVGSGKTIVAALALLLAVENGYQGTLMAPTEVLAKQHYNYLSSLFEPLGFKTALLTGSMSIKQKKDIYNQLENGIIKILIGTHAIIQDNTIFKNLAISITDEQHRFGVKQRERLTGKGNYPHVLVMSATPIPRTLALIVYQDMDVSIIDELPSGRQEIKTYCVNSNYRKRIYDFLEKEINKGRQAYIVCPMIDENEDLELESVILYKEKLQEKINPNIIVEALHGNMKATEKNNIMERFSNKEIDILISTTVIEVGINVPNATIMIIENAERFGLAAIHQLRGRVGRGKHQSYCILVTDSKTEISKKRMEILKKNTNGFIISEYDLKLRGPGDAFGIKQHGLPEFKIGNIYENLDILQETNIVAKKLIEENNMFKTNITEFISL